MLRRAEAALEVAEAADAVEGIADHQQCPAVTEQVGAAGNGQGLLACMLGLRMWLQFKTNGDSLHQVSNCNYIMSASMSAHC